MWRYPVKRMITGITAALVVFPGIASAHGLAGEPMLIGCVGEGPTAVQVGNKTADVKNVAWPTSRALQSQ
jgi:hypothetical protein